MSISEHAPAAGPAGVLAGLLGVVRDLDQTLWSARPEGELVEVVAVVQQLSAALAAVEAGAVAEADVRDLAKQRLCYGSTADWVTHVGGLRRGEGKQRLARAKALTGPLSGTRAALVAGTCSPGQADVIIAAVADLPPGEWVRRRGEKVMLRHATGLDACDLAKAGRHLVEVVDPDAADRRLEAALAREERAAHLGRTLSITPDRAGGVRIRGRGSAEDGAVLKAALLPLTRPQPPDTSTTGSDVDVDEATGEPCTGVRDPRDHGTRLWDALVSTAQHALDTRRVPDSHAVGARLVVTFDHQTLQDDLQARGIATTADGLDLPADVLRRLACDAEIVPAVYGTRGEVLDVGRTRRLVTPALWTALVIRDRHCTFPACTRPPVMCHAHHLHHWADGGDTSLDNLALLCGHHHRIHPPHPLGHPTQPR